MTGRNWQRTKSKYSGAWLHPQSISVPLLYCGKPLFKKREHPESKLTKVRRHTAQAARRASKRKMKITLAGGGRNEPDVS